MSDKVVMNRTVNISWDTWERLQLFCKIHDYKQSYIADHAINKFLDIQPVPVGVSSKQPKEN